MVKLLRLDVKAKAITTDSLSFIRSITKYSPCQVSTQPFEISPLSKYSEGLKKNSTLVSILSQINQAIFLTPLYQSEHCLQIYA